MTKKKKLYITFSLFLAATTISSIATFSYLNVKVKPNIEIINNQKETNAYGGRIDLSTKLIRIPDSHELEYKWFMKTSRDNDFKEVSVVNNLESIVVENKAIEEVSYYVQLDDKTDNKIYKSKPVVINFVEPELYLSATVNNDVINPYLDFINSDSVTINVNISKDIAELDSKEGWFIYKKSNSQNLKSIEKILQARESNTDFDFVSSNNFTLIGKNKRELKISNLKELKTKLSQEYVLRYFWTDIKGKELIQDLQLKIN